MCIRDRPKAIQEELQISSPCPSPWLVHLVVFRCRAGGCETGTFLVETCVPFKPCCVVNLNTASEMPSCLVASTPGDNRCPLIPLFSNIRRQLRNNEETKQNHGAQRQTRSHHSEAESITINVRLCSLNFLLVVDYLLGELL